MIDFNSNSFVQLRRVKDMSEVTDSIAPLLFGSEKCILTYQGLRDCLAFTSKRIIALNVQGVTGKKKDFTSIPYSRISSFSVETAGVTDSDTELELFISGLGKIKISFAQVEDILLIGRVLSIFVMGDKEEQLQELEFLKNQNRATPVIINSDEWQCSSCGRVNKNYVGTCGCGNRK